MNQPRTYTRYFYDTEFLDNGNTIGLISIGIVAEDGREYYAVHKWMPVLEIRRNPWLFENVWPSLPLTSSGYLDESDPVMKPRHQIAEEVRRFLLAGDRPELWGWYSGYDHVVLAQLWGAMVDLPKGIPMWTNDLRQEMHRLDRAGRHIHLPEQEHGTHNALEDARHLKRRFDHMVWFANEEDVLAWR